MQILNSEYKNNKLQEYWTESRNCLILRLLMNQVKDQVALEKIEWNNESYHNKNEEKYSYDSNWYCIVNYDLYWCHMEDSAYYQQSAL